MCRDKTSRHAVRTGKTTNGVRNMTEVITSVASQAIEDDSSTAARPHSRAARPAGLVALGLFLAIAGLVAALAPRWARERAASAAAGPATTPVKVTLTGAGATFPQPFYARLFE